MPETPINSRPILYSGPMVRALLAGSKTQTRRVLNPQPGYPGIARWVFELHPFAPSAFRGTPAEGISFAPQEEVWSYEDWCGNLVGTYGACPFGRPGDRLWVREAFCPDWCDRPIYRADDPTLRAAFEAGYPSSPRYRPSIHMPRRLSRISLKIEAVRVERAGSITDADILAEGIEHYAAGLGLDASTPTRRRGLWEHLWDAVNGDREGGRYAFARDPWTWVIEFRRLGGSGVAHAG
jgi:hypothetical protein